MRRRSLSLFFFGCAVALQVVLQREATGRNATLFGASLRRRRDPDQCFLAADTSNARVLEARRDLHTAASLQSVGILDGADPGGQALEVVRRLILRCRLSNTVHVLGDKITSVRQSLPLPGKKPQ